MKDRSLRYEVDTGKYVGSWYIEHKLDGERWLCRCECGERREISTTQLKFGITLQCKKCFDTKQRKPKIDMTGMKVGNVTVVSTSGGGSWNCICSCGKNIIVKGFNLRKALETGKNYMCEKCSQENKRDKLEGKKINNWTIIRYVGKGMYECKCGCSDTLHIRSGKSIKTGASTSCGCTMGEKIISTRLERYGEVATNKISNKREGWQIQCVRSKDTLEEFILNFGLAGSTLTELSDILGITPCMVGRLIHAYGLEEYVDYNSTVSSYETEIYNIVYNYGSEVIQSDRTILNGKELDIYFPDKKVAIEFNGMYWHSDIYKDKNYHQDKTIACRDQGIRLIHIFEHEWLDDITREKIINLLKSVLTDEHKLIYAKNTEIRHVDKLESDIFLENYHLQGTANASIRLGLYSDNELIGLATFGKPRFNSNFEYELIRLAWKPGIRVVGGFEKLFKHFISQYNPQSVISYCDISKFTGESYQRVGFKTDWNKLTEPNYVWVSTSDNEVLKRYQTQKHILLKNGFDVYGDTEDEIMTNLGYLKIYDSGNLRFEWYKEH